MKLRIVLCVASVLSLLLLSKAHADDEFVFLLKGRGNVFWKVIREAIDETATARKIHAVLLHTDDDQTPEAQLNMCLASISRKPKVIVLGAATKNVGLECFKKAAAAGIQVADIDGNVSVADAKEANLSLAFSVGSNNYQIGKLAAEYLVKNAPKKKTKVLILKGLPGSIVSEDRVNGFVDELKKSLPDATIAGIAAVDWDRLKAMNTTLDYLQRDPEIEYVYSVSDVMTLGAYEGIKVAGKTAAVQILSVDGIADGRKAVLESKIAADVAQLPYLMGKRAVELAIDAAAGGVHERTEYTPTPVLTKEVLTEMKDPNLVYLR